MTTTLKGIVSAFLSTRRLRNLSPNTIIFYSQHLSKFLEFTESHYPDVSLEQIDHNILREYVSERLCCMNRRYIHLFFLQTILYGCIGQRFSHFKHPIQDSTTNRGFPFLSFIILGSHPSANDFLVSIECIFRVTL